MLEVVRQDGYALRFASDALKEDKEVVLEAENKNYKSQVYKSGSNIKIQGILSGLIRKYN